METTHTPAHQRETTRQSLRRNARLWIACFRLAIIRETQFRGNFLATIVIGVLQVLLGIVPVLVVFSYADDINGWSRADVIVILGVHQAMMGTLGMFIGRNMWGLSDDIRTGNLDQMLLRPVDALFHAATRWIRPEKSFDVMAGLAVVAVGLARGEGWPGPIALLQCAVLFGCGFVLIGCAWTAVTCCAFWAQSTLAITLFFQDVLEAGRYPVWFFPAVLRLALTVVVPLAFATTFPSEALAHGVSWWLVLGAIMFAATAIVALRAFWRLAILSYASASS
jgi:ABC-2 type transport system permease protein